MLGALGAQVMSSRVIATAVSTLDFHAFGEKDSDLGVLQCVVGIATQHTPGAFVAVYHLVAKTTTLLTLNSLWMYMCNMADAWDRVKVEDFVVNGLESGEVVVISNVDIEGGKVGTRDVVASPANRVGLFVVEGKDFLIKDVIPYLVASVGDGVVKHCIGVDELSFASYVKFLAHNVCEEHGGMVFEHGNAKEIGE